MSQENVEIVLAAFAAVQAGDYERCFELLDEDIVWDMSGLELSDLAKVYRGHDGGHRESWTAWLRPWASLEFTSLVPKDHGDHVLIEIHQRNRGRNSGIDVDFHYFQVYTVGTPRSPRSR